MLLQEIQTKKKEKTLVAKAGLSFDATVRFYCSVGAWSVPKMIMMTSEKGGV